MRIALAVLFALHGIAHGVGFVASWDLAELEEMSYKTTLLAGRLDVGDLGIRAMGIVWLVAGLAFVVAGLAAWTRQAWWPSLAVAAALFSLALCVLGWPDARIGVAVNLAILALLLLGGRYGWLPGA